MKCQGCNLEFPNLNTLTKHKKVCAGIPPAFEMGEGQPEPNAYKITIDNESMQPIPSDLAPGCLIPLSMCPEEIKLFAVGHTVGLRVEGSLTANGIIVQEVKLIR